LILSVAEGFEMTVPPVLLSFSSGGEKSFRRDAIKTLALNHYRCIDKNEKFH
jgi:hypothetical protein